MSKEEGINRTVLYVANTDWYVLNFRLDLLRRAQSLGWMVHVACPLRQHSQKLRAYGFTLHSVEFDTVGLSPLSETKSLLQLARIFNRVKPEIIHLFTLKCVLYGATVASAADNAKIIGAITGLGHLFTTANLRTWVLKQPVIFALRRTLRGQKIILIFQNSGDREEFRQMRIIAAKQAVVIRGSGVDCKKFVSSGRTPDAHLPLRLLFCGRLLAEKGIHEYLAATRKLRKKGFIFESRIAGEPYLGNPSSLSASDIDRLRTEEGHQYLGHHEDVAALLAETDIVVLPTYREGTPKALLEAAASGCVLVATDIPGCRGVVVPERNGFLVPVKSVNAIVEALTNIFNSDRSKIDEMKQASREIAVADFSDQHVNNATLALYNYSE